MPYVLLIHWNEDESKPRVKELQRLGLKVEWIAPRGGRGLQPYIRNPPEAFLIDLTRMPSHGRAIGVFLRQRKATRNVPIVFLDGEPEKVEKTRELLPDATYLEWKDISKLQRSIAQAGKRATIRPNTMAEYARVPLAKKLGVKEGVEVVSIGVPDEVRERIGDYEEARTGDRVLFFARSMLDLLNGFEAAVVRVKRDGSLWVFWPKQSSGSGSDITLPQVRAVANEFGWTDYRICSVDETWSGMLFTRMKKQSAKRAPENPRSDRQPSRGSRKN